MFWLASPRENFEARLVLDQKTGQVVAIQSLEIFHGISDRKVGLKVQEHGNMPNRASEVEQYDALLGCFRQLSSKIDRNRCSSYAAFCPYKRDQFFGFWSRVIAWEAAQEFLKHAGCDGRGQKLLNSVTHGTHHKLEGVSGGHGRDSYMSAAPHGMEHLIQFQVVLGSTGNDS